MGLKVCAAYGEGSKAGGRLPGGVHFRLRARQRPHPPSPGLKQYWVAAKGLHWVLLFDALYSLFHILRGALGCTRRDTSP